MSVEKYIGKHIHFIGIGGISMSGLAQIMFGRGCTVSGSDRTASEITKKLEDIGMDVRIGHNLEALENADLVVHTAAIASNDPELVAAKNMGKEIMDRASFLGKLMGEYKNAIGVAGTHGKTTTTGMLSSIFLQAGKNPTIHIGGRLDLIDSSVYAGGNDFFITEACEYVESFLSMMITSAIVLNIDNDHLDYYRDINHVYDAFKRFVGLIPSNGLLVGCADDPLTLKLMREAGIKTLSYGVDNESDYMAVSIETKPDASTSFELTEYGSSLGRIDLSVPGRHNVLNALAAIALSRSYGISFDDIKEGLARFKGADRRFSNVGSINGAEIIHDYAHHPTEICATLQSARSLNPNSIYCVFQPHTYSRMRLLFDELCSCFADADHVIITDIYAAREANTFGVHARDLVDALCSQGKDCIYIPMFADIAKYLRSSVKPGDLVLTLGAGSIDQLTPMLTQSPTDSSVQKSKQIFVAAHT